MNPRTVLRNLFVLGLVLLATAGTVAGPAMAAGGTQADDCTFPMTATDATGTDVTIDAEPETVVTLGPSAAQTMWEIGAKDKVVGVTKYASYLDGADSRTNVSGAGRTAVVAEKVVELDPDLVLAPNIIPDETVKKLRDAGLTVYKFEWATTLDDVTQKTLLFGRLTGTCDGATERVDEMNATLSKIETAVADKDKPKVLYYMGGGYTAGSGTYIDTIIETAGGTNIAAEAGIQGYGPVSPEIVVAENPNWILKNTDFVSIPKTEAYNGTTAVEDGNVMTLNANYVSQPAPRTVTVVERLAETFHGELTTETTTTTINTKTTTTATTETAEQSTETTSVETPGMGIESVLLALVLVGLFRRR